MEQDDFIVEAAGWARYYERVGEIIRHITSAQIADAPPQEIIDDPQAFNDWVKQCEKIYRSRNTF
jgi:hypothetical protein